MLYYYITVTGHLDGNWSEWFDGLTITHSSNGETILSGPIVDQAALHGLLQKIRDLCLPLLEVTQSAPSLDDVSAKFHNRDLVAWIDDYCSSHPNEPLIRAADALMRELARLALQPDATKPGEQKH